MNSRRLVRLPWAGALGAVASSLALGLASSQQSFTLGDTGGVFFRFIVAPGLGMLAGGIVSLVFPRDLLVAPLVLVPVSIFLAGWGGYKYGIEERIVPGYYHLPSPNPVEGASVDGLVKLATDQNDEVRHAALERLGKIGPAGADGLVQVIDRIRALAPKTWMESYEAYQAAKLLAEAGDRRAVPVLQTMVHGQSSANEARRLLWVHFMTEAERPER